MALRLAKLVPFVEERLRESLHTAISIAVLRPIVNRKHSRNSKGLDGLTLRNKVGIFFARQLADRIVVGEKLGIGNRNKVQAGVGRYLCEEVDGLSNYTDQSGKLAGFDLLQCGRIVEQDLFNLHPKSLKNDRSRQA